MTFANGTRGNPIIQTRFTAGPAPIMHDGAVYVFTGHDEDDAPPGRNQFRVLD